LMAAAAGLPADMDFNAALGALFLPRNGARSVRGGVLLRFSLLFRLEFPPSRLFGLNCGALRVDAVDRIRSLPTHGTGLECLLLKDRCWLLDIHNSEHLTFGIRSYACARRIDLKRHFRLASILSQASEKSQAEVTYGAKETRSRLSRPSRIYSQSMER
jgi:hypothetical protein